MARRRAQFQAKVQLRHALPRLLAQDRYGDCNATGGQISASRCGVPRRRLHCYDRPGCHAFRWPRWRVVGIGPDQTSQSEGVRCTAYYSESNQRLRLAIRCKSASNEIEIRGQLAQRAAKITGTWEERTFNVSGDATGHITPGRMSLSITGGAFSGAMSVAYARSKQVISISIQGISMKSVSITLVRS